ncbi:MAG: VOC family protein [Bryobacteraceae bacterium]
MSKGSFLKLAISALVISAAASGQLAVPNAAGVAMGHLHLNVTDIEAHKAFWAGQLGGEAVKFHNIDVIKFPGMVLFLKRAATGGASDGSAVGHIGFLVRDLDPLLVKWKASGVRVVSENMKIRGVFILSPDDVKIEVYEDKTISAPIVNHHIHFFNQAMEETKAWYVKIFGAKPGKRAQFEAADLPGVNLTFSASKTPTAPTKGRTLDHIGFEIKDLEAFCKRLEGMGVKFNVPYRKVPAIQSAIAFFTDPWGTYVELTEGLSAI